MNVVITFLEITPLILFVDVYNEVKNKLNVKM